MYVGIPDRTILKCRSKTRCEYQELIRVWLALILAFSPWEKVWPSRVFGLADQCSANPVASLSKKAANDSPSPGGEGWGEDERIE
jgi:hypothetical protein